MVTGFTVEEVLDVILDDDFELSRQQEGKRGYLWVP